MSVCTVRGAAGVVSVIDDLAPDIRSARSAPKVVVNQAHGAVQVCGRSQLRQLVITMTHRRGVRISNFCEPVQRNLRVLAKWNLLACA